MTKPISELFSQFKEAKIDAETRYNIFSACVNDIYIEAADIPKLVDYFGEEYIYRILLNILRPKTISSSILIETISKCTTLHIKLGVLRLLILHLPSFDSLNHKVKLIELCKGDPKETNAVVELIRDKKIIENCGKDSNTASSSEKNQEPNNAPPPYNASGSPPDNQNEKDIVQKMHNKDKNEQNRELL
jgi:hypothetical protein